MDTCQQIRDQHGKDLAEWSNTAFKEATDYVIDRACLPCATDEERLSSSVVALEVVRWQVGAWADRPIYALKKLSDLELKDLVRVELNREARRVERVNKLRERSKVLRSECEHGVWVGEHNCEQCKGLPPDVKPAPITLEELERVERFLGKRMAGEMKQRILRGQNE